MNKWLMLALVCLLSAAMVSVEAAGHGHGRGGFHRGGGAVFVAGPTIGIGVGYGWPWYSPWNSFATAVVAGSYLSNAVSDGQYRSDVRRAITELTNAIQGLVRVVGDQGMQITKLQSEIAALK